jgi:hypothetical protein
MSVHTGSHIFIKATLTRVCFRFAPVRINFHAGSHRFTNFFVSVHTVRIIIFCRFTLTESLVCSTFWVWASVPGSPKLTLWFTVGRPWPACRKSSALSLLQQSDITMDRPPTTSQWPSGRVSTIKLSTLMRKHCLVSQGRWKRSLAFAGLIMCCLSDTRGTPEP